MEWTNNIMIDQPTDKVFAFISDFSNHQRIFKANIDSRQTSKGPVKVGTTMTNVASFIGLKLKEHFVVTAFEPGKRIAKASVSDSSVETGDQIVLESVNGNTMLRFKAWAQPSGLLKLLPKSFLHRKVDKILCNDMLNLKTLLEEESPVQ